MTVTREKGGEGIGEKGERFVGTIRKDTWTITKGMELGEGGGGKKESPNLERNSTLIEFLAYFFRSQTVQQ